MQVAPGRVFPYNTAPIPAPRAVNAPPYGYVWPRHLGQATVTFVDSHCKAQTLDALRAGIDPATGQIVDPEKCLWDLK